ncbi:unnamed protein product [Triticum turgidum subsp. durum]|uniref:GDSL esterase/lipase n=1 Tax=Triticum turgidum subsp. durum TaxID=4567 RepID=A0A9R1QLG1_TRITD|nr:unnamed protein product [Triticum turgidum subsp. durum]
MERVSPWLLLLVLLVAASGPGARADPQVPCYFVFGDSLVDNGNNNDIASLARANYPPYGIDFPGGATGRFTYINAYGIFQDIIRSPGANGLTVLDKGCCGVGRNNGQVTCLPFQTPCANRNEYLFWDAFHPTEAANILVGRRAYSAAQPSDVHPVDLQTLARL